MFMKAIGLICEYNPFHNGHLYHIKKIKEMYPNHVLVLVLGGYFLERGDVSLMSKWNKTKVALDFGIDLVLELPLLFGVNSSDFFAEYAVSILNKAHVDKIVFGSESDEVEFLKSIARKQLERNFSDSVKKNLSAGNNYPSSLAASLGVKLDSNDILGVSYIKAIEKLSAKIEPITIKRTNSFNDIKSSDTVVSAQNIRERLANKEDITKYIPEYDKNLLNEVNYGKFFELLKYRIMTEKNLERFLGVDEGLENKLKKEIVQSNNYREFLDRIISKRYTRSRLKRMCVHILLGILKEDMNATLEKAKILGFNKLGQEYLRELKTEELAFKIDTRANDIEKTSSMVYYILTSDKSVFLESCNKPIQRGI